MKSPWIRRTAIAVGALLLLLIVAAVVLVATFDTDRYKALAIDWMMKEHRRTLAIDGPIELSLFPRLAFKVSGVKLSEPGRADPFVTVDEAALAVEVLPLLGKRLVVDRVSARGVHATYRRAADGTRNIDDLLGAGSRGTASGSAGAAASDSGAALRFDISQVRLDDLHLRFRDEVPKRAGEVVLQSFASGRLANHAKSPVTLRATLQLTEPAAAKVALDGHLTLALDLDHEAFDATDLKLAVNGSAGALQSLSATLGGAVAWDGNALVAGPLDLAVKSATLGGLALAPSTLAVQRALYNPKGAHLELAALKLHASGRLSGDPFELALDWPKVAATADKVEGSALSGRAKLDGALPLVATFRSAAPSGGFDALRLPGVVLTLAGGAGARKVEGRATTDVTLQVGRRALALDNLDLHATLAGPGLQPVDLTLRGSAGAGATAAQWKLDGTVDAGRFDSSGHASFAGAVPRVDASAHFASLDLNRLLASSRQVAASAVATAAPAETPVRLEVLRALDGRFDVSAAALAFRRYRVGDAKVVATLEGGLLRIERLTGRAWGGRIDASGSAQAGSGRIAVKLAANGVDVDALLKTVAGKDLLEGTGRVVADVTASGATLGALRSSLAGSAALQLRNGAIKGINLARVLRQAKAALTMKGDSVTKASAAEKTDFTEMTASARIAGGVARSDDLDVKSPFLRIGGAGTFDIGRGRVDYTARATVTATAAGQGGAELAALNGITVPVALTGPFDAIDWRIEWSGVAASLIEKQVKGRIAEELGARLGLGRGSAASAPRNAAPKDLLRNTLKGLFR